MCGEKTRCATRSATLVTRHLSLVTLLVICHLSLLTFSGCSNPIVLWEAPITYNGVTMERVYYDTIMADFRPYESVHVVTSDGAKSATSDIAGEWSISVDSPQESQGFWCTKQDYDSAYIEITRRDAKREGLRRIAPMCRTIIDTVSDFRIDVDSMRNDTMWYRVHATVPPSYLFVTVFFFDSVESDAFRVKKWCATLNTLAVVRAQYCDGRPLMKTDLHFVQSMFDANTLFACVAVGEPIGYYTSTPDSEGSNIVTVSGVGKITALRAVRH
jgi:hypothetical protein